MRLCPRLGAGPRREARLPPPTPAQERRPRLLPARRQDGHVRAHRTRPHAPRRARRRHRQRELRMAPVELPTLPVVQSPSATAPRTQERERLVRRAKVLAWIGVGWHGIEAAIAVGAGVAAGSIALIGFGADSLVEAFAGFIVLWRFASARAASPGAERRAQQL